MITDWIVAFTSILVVIVAIFQDQIKAKFLRPRLDITISLRPPDCHKIPIGRQTHQGYLEVDAYYFRLRVKNLGNLKAEAVEVYASELLVQQPDGFYSTVPSFLPMNLAWTHYKQPVLAALSPGMQKHCDLGYILNPNGRAKFEREDYPDFEDGKERTILSLDLQRKPVVLSHLIPPGKYHLVLLIAAANSRPLKRLVQIQFSGDWFESELEMLAKGIEIKII